MARRLRIFRNSSAISAATKPAIYLTRPGGKP
jgi:hypothetical protein